jgi:hypothetical protein
MRLTAEMYEQIVAALKSDSHGDRDKRRQPRVGMAAEADFVMVIADGARIAGVVRVRDVSASGIGLLFARQIAKNQRFVLQLYGANEQPLWLVCTAAYCRGGEEDRYSVGARIQQILKADQIQRGELNPNAIAAAAARANAKVDMTDVERISRAILG